MRLTLVTPSFNQAAYLPLCLESVINQPRFEDVDYIIMDGGSTDGSKDIIEAHAEHLHYWRSNKDGGHYLAIEEGFTCSDGEIMGWLNSDDMMTPWALRIILRIFETLPDVHWITTQYPLVADAAGMVFRTDMIPGVDSFGFFNGEHVPTAGGATTGFIQQESTFWRRSLWESAGGTFDHTYKMACDFELWARFINKTPLHTVPIPLSIYRVHGDNKAVADWEIYRNECMDVLRRYNRFDPSQAEKLEVSVLRKNLSIFGKQTLVKQGDLPLYKRINISEDGTTLEVIDV